MNNNTGIYAIVSPSGKMYIGSAVSIRSRWNQHRSHLRRGTHCNRKLQSAWNKYGESGMEFVILACCPITDLLAAEQARINSLKPAYNIALTAGSPMRGRKFSKESLERLALSRAQTPHPYLGKSWPNHPRHGQKLSEYERSLISARQMGVKNHAFGKPKSAESNAKRSSSQKGKPKSEQFREKHRGAGNPRARSVMCVETGVEFKAICIAVEFLKRNGRPNAAPSSISQACSGRLKTAYGHKWRYIS